MCIRDRDYEIKVGDNFDVKSDYTGLTIQDDSKVKVTFQEAKDTDGSIHHTSKGLIYYQIEKPNGKYIRKYKKG